MPSVFGVVYDDTGMPSVGNVCRLYRRDTGELLATAVTSDGAGDEFFDDVAYHYPLSEDYADKGGGSVPLLPLAGLGGPLSSAYSRFGTKSFKMDGSYPSVRTMYGSHARASLSGEWTIEAWMYMVAPASSIICRRPSDAAGWALTSNGLRAKLNGAWSDTQLNWTSPSSGAWHHYALQLNGTTLRMFIDGVVVASKTGVTSIDNPDLPIAIGSSISTGPGENVGASAYNDVRITKAARYDVTGFTPAITPMKTYPASLSIGQYELRTAYTGEVNRVVLDLNTGTLYNDQIERVILT